MSSCSMCDQTQNLVEMLLETQFLKFGLQLFQLRVQIGACINEQAADIPQSMKQG